MAAADTDIILKTTFDVTSADTDLFGRLRLGALVNFLIQAAIQSADSLGFGFGGLKNEQLFWVLSRITVEIYRPFKWYEKVKVTTWPKDIDKLLYLRDFEVSDSHGHIVAKATSGWLAVDFHTKKPRHVGDSMNPTLNRLREKHALSLPPEKLDSSPGGDIFSATATYFDIDLNCHVTSTRYIDWMMDTFEAEFHKNHYPVAFSVNYLRETLLGETLSIMRKSETGSIFSFDGIEGERSKFRGKIRF